jgi:hypothetical protein
MGAPGHPNGHDPTPCPLDHIAIDMCEFGGVLHSINELVSATTRSQYILVCHTIPHIRCALPAPGPGVTVKAVHVIARRAPSTLTFDVLRTETRVS